MINYITGLFYRDQITDCEHENFSLAAHIIPKILINGQKYKKFEAGMQRELSCTVCNEKTILCFTLQLYKQQRVSWIKKKRREVLYPLLWHRHACPIVRDIEFMARTAFTYICSCCCTRYDTVFKETRRTNGAGFTSASRLTRRLTHGSLMTM